MFRETRKKKSELTNDKVIELLINSRRGVLAVNGDDDYPYAIPINFYYDKDNNKIYFHGSKLGHKVDSLNKSNKVCFTIVSNPMIKEETWAPFVQSVIIFGRCRKIDDAQETEKRIKQFGMKYLPNEEMVIEEINKAGKNVQIYEIEIEHISGKEIQEK